jgi:hypothetical protein
MPDPIPKYLTDRNLWEVENFIDHARTGELPINPEWQNRHDEALADAGIELDDSTETADGEPTIEAIADRMSRNRLP